jgi:hypothetical protein
VEQLRFIDATGAISARAGEPRFFNEVFGNPRVIRTMFATARMAAEGGLPSVVAAADRIVPETILDHMPKAYACAIRRQVT